MVLNKEWHRSDCMPTKATREQWIDWHLAFVRVCGCREIPGSIKSDVDKLFKRRKR